MKRSIFLKGFVLAVVALPLTTGCKKKDTGATEGSAAPTGSGSATAPATGSGSSTTPAAGSGSATTPATGSGSAVAATGSGSAVAAAGSGSGSAAPVALATPWAADAAAVAATSKVTG